MLRITKDHNLKDSSIGVSVNPALWDFEKNKPGRTCLNRLQIEQLIPILQQTVGSIWKKEDELTQLKSEVVALERKVPLELAPPKPEAAQEQQADGGTVQDVSSERQNGDTKRFPDKDTAMYVIPIIGPAHTSPSFVQEHAPVARPQPTEEHVQVKGFRM